MCGLIRVSNSTESTWVASPTPSKRAWLRFKRHRLGFASLVLFVVMTVLSLGAELISNDKPLLARYDGRWFVPLVQNLPETVFGGDFDTPTDFLDPYIQGQFAKPGNFRFAILICQRKCNRRTHNAGNVVRATATITLLSPTQNKWF